MTARCVLCLDADTFFLAVHRRADPSLDDSRPLVLHQHHDIICANRAAKLLGVVKHMRPSVARGLIGPRGQIIHAYYRDWPGPRVWIEPYQEASRSMFAVSLSEPPVRNCQHPVSLPLPLPRSVSPALPPSHTHAHAHAPSPPGFPSVSVLGPGCPHRQVVRAVIGPDRAFERASIDEGYVEVCGRDCYDAAVLLAAELRSAVYARTGLPVSLGIGPNKLLAKLSASAAKREPSKLVCTTTAQPSIDAVLRATPAAKLPQLGAAAAWTPFWCHFLTPLQHPCRPTRAVRCTMLCSEGQVPFLKLAGCLIGCLRSDVVPKLHAGFRHRACRLPRHSAVAAGA